MLPKEVASEIQSRERSMPERIESATIYFSDIVDFMSIVERNSPVEVGNIIRILNTPALSLYILNNFQTAIFLNTLYKMFDARIDKYEVYKVETTNDSFMIASGIPGKVGKRLGDHHGSEIATMALDLLGGSAMFVIPQRPKVNSIIFI